MNRTRIEWVKNPDGTPGYTWNPITGCLNGCEYCYARKLANGRLKPLYLENYNIGWSSEPSLAGIDYDDPFAPRFWEPRLDDPLFHNKPAGIFVCDMGELFGDWIPLQWQRLVFWTIKSCPQHRFYLLTKQPQNLVKFSPFPDNCYVGVTVTNKEGYVKAINGLSLIKAKIKYISFEPLLERMTDGSWFSQQGLLSNLENFVDWVIIGAQTKPYKPPKIEWVEEIVNACDKAGIPVFLKDNLMPLTKELWGLEVIRQGMPNL